MQNRAWTNIWQSERYKKRPKRTFPRLKRTFYSPWGNCGISCSRGWGCLFWDPPGKPSSGLPLRGGRVTLETIMTIISGIKAWPTLVENEAVHKVVFLVLFFDKSLPEFQTTHLNPFPGGASPSHGKKIKKNREQKTIKAAFSWICPNVNIHSIKGLLPHNSIKTLTEWWFFSSYIILTCALNGNIIFGSSSVVVVSLYFHLELIFSCCIPPPLISGGSLSPVCFWDFQASYWFPGSVRFTPSYFDTCCIMCI